MNRKAGHRVVPLAAPPDAIMRVPGSKSFTNRALICAALARGTSVLENALHSDDTEALLYPLTRLKVPIHVDDAAGTITIEGCDGRLSPGPVELDVRYSGTASRFLVAVLAASTGRYRVGGTTALQRRPMGPLLDALRSLGATIVEEGLQGCLPVTIEGRSLAGGRVQLSGDVSSQFVSGLLLASPLLHNGVRVELTSELVSKPYLGVTTATMSAFGVEVRAEDDRAYEAGPGHYEACRFVVEPDATAASYFFAAAAITGGRVRVDGLGTSTVQGDLRFVDVLERMGAHVIREPHATEVRGSGVLHGIDVNMSDISDTAQTLAAVAVFADSPTRVHGIGFIRNKETDRIGAVVRELARCGIRAVEEADGFVVNPGTPVPARIHTYEDHRMAMSFALIGLRTGGIEILDPGSVAKTFPRYFTELEQLRR